MSKIYSNPVHRRRFIGIALVATALITSACVTKPSPNPARILFVCQAGTAKSPIARELLKRRAAERGIAIEVFSRGIAIADHVSPALKQRLRADGIDTSAEPPMPLQPTDWAAADILVSFNPLPQRVVHHDLRDWTDVPSVNDDYANARAVMEKRIDELLTELEGRKNRR